VKSNLDPPTLGELMANTSLLFEQLGLALLLGLLVGLQREHAASGLVGMRSFALITVLGTVAGQLGASFGGWVVAAGFLGVVGVLAFAHLTHLKEIPFRRVSLVETENAPVPAEAIHGEPRGKNGVGITTDVAALVMFGVGSLLVVGPLSVAVAVGSAVAILLHFKPELHTVARKLGDEDLRAIMQFVLITCIILPVLPRDPLDPYGVLSPFETWLFVVLIVGINLGGYIAYKFLGPQAGILLGGLLGGAVSSTATTFSYSRQARLSPVLANSAAVVIMIASAVIYVRILVLVGVIAPDFLISVAAPLLILAMASFLAALVFWRWAPRELAEMPRLGNPTQLRSAIVLGLTYAVVIVALAAARDWLGHSELNALYGIAGLSGLTDVDAITLSTARMSKTDPMVAAEGWRLIVVATLSNLVFKAGVAGLLGGRALLRPIAALFAVPLVTSLLLLGLWR
jgi:uncharacterized membrane protein (DUF4010 family)